MHCYQKFSNAEVFFFTLGLRRGVKGNHSALQGKPEHVDLI
jgi:hypothetical protein